MWKLLVGFAVFAALALFILSRGGDIDMSGEKHGMETPDAHPPASSVAAAASSLEQAASSVTQAASAVASAASAASR